MSEATQPWYTVGLDLGQSADPSALAALESREVPAEDGRDAPRVRRHLVRGLTRWPLRTSYVKIVDDVAAMLGSPPLEGCTLVIDATGVGRPVYDLFREAALRARLMGVIITAGQGQSFADDGFWHTAKVVLVSSVLVPLQQRRLLFAPRMRETAVLVKELQNYRRVVTAKANETFDPREGEHDDLVLALALACWQAERADPPGRPEVWPEVLGGGYDRGRLTRGSGPPVLPASLW